MPSLDVAIVEALREICDDHLVLRRAGEPGIEPVVLIVALLAHSQRHCSRTAERIARKVFGDKPPMWIEELAILVADMMDRCPQAGP